MIIIKRIKIHKQKFHKLRDIIVKTNFAFFPTHMFDGLNQTEEYEEWIWLEKYISTYKRGEGYYTDKDYFLVSKKRCKDKLVKEIEIK